MKILNENCLIFDDEISLAKKSIFEKDCFSIVLTGGQSALSLYKLLSKANSNWDKWHIYIGDERFLPAGYKDRNDQTINEIWLDNSPIPKKNIHFIKVELGLLEARVDYENTLKKIDKFDVVLLSMGDDGHIASLFPGYLCSKNTDVVVEYNSLKPPNKRIYISYRKLNKTHNVFKIILGQLKRQAMSLLFRRYDLPINRVYGEVEKIFIHSSAIPVGGEQ
jgi:6-phosphogluconolactonase